MSNDMAGDAAAAMMAEMPTVNPWSVPFMTQILPEAFIAAANPELPYEGGREALLRRFAWAVPPAGTQRALSTKLFYADRYGGGEIQRNGGGARCASDGAWQVKGCGINPLAGIDNDGAIPRSGMAPLLECLFEALWGEIFHHALPYGSTRICAVIHTGLFDADAPTPIDRPWGLAVREAAWRPAHFMRAHEFRPAPQFAAILPSDTERVRGAISQLDRLLPMPAGYPPGDWRALPPLERLHAGLDEMVRRFGEQIAAAVSKRLMHGTLTASNICLDGRWIDFATASAMPGWASRLRNLASLTEEYRALPRPLATLCFYINKYFPLAPSERPRLPQPDQLLQTYVSHYNLALEKRMAGLCGCQGELARGTWADAAGQAAMRQLAQIVLGLATSGAIRRHGSADYPDPLARDGDYDVLAVLDLLPPTARSGAEARLAAMLPSQTLRARLISAHEQVFAAMWRQAEEARISQSALRRLMRLHRRKAALTEPFFNRRHMGERLGQMLLELTAPDALTREVERIWRHAGQRARLLYRDADGYSCLLWCDETGDLTYDACGDCVTATRHGRVQRFTLPQLLSADQLPADVSTWVRDMRAFWGVDLWATL